MSKYLIPVAALIAAVGCSGTTDDLLYVPVSGRITVGGSPAANVYVLFQPQSDGNVSETGTPSVAFTDAEGNFTIQNKRYPSRGAIVGGHLVRVYGAESRQAFDFWNGGGVDPSLPPEARPDASLIPEQKPVPEVSVPRDKRQRSYTVPEGGTDEANFDL